MPDSLRQQIKSACETVRSGGVVAYPTESCYGLGCHPKNYSAVKKILKLKHRSSNKGLILIAHDISQLSGYFDTLPVELLEKLSASWPSRTTWLVPAARWMPTWIKGSSSKIAVRVPAHKLARELSKQCGHPLISTSANLSGQGSARSAKQVEHIFSSRVDFVIKAPCGREKRASTIIDLLSNQVIRY